MAGIGGVLFFVFERRIALAGAQEPEVLNAAIDQALADGGEGDDGPPRAA